MVDIEESLGIHNLTDIERTVLGAISEAESKGLSTSATDIEKMVLRLRRVSRVTYYRALRQIRIRGLVVVRSAPHDSRVVLHFLSDSAKREHRLNGLGV